MNKHEIVAYYKRNTLIGAYSEELDALRSRYFYTLTKNELGPLWSAGSRVKAEKRKRMVKLMKLIDIVNGVIVAPRYSYWLDAPTLERYHWRMMLTPIDGSKGHLWKTFYSDKFQIGHKP